jgi:low affinity Fe/Cu permease
MQSSKEIARVALSDDEIMARWFQTELCAPIPVYPPAIRTDMSSKKQAKEPSIVSKFFGQLANRTSLAAGRASTFILAAGVVFVWAISGPLFGFSDTWQLVINTGTTIVTFMMVFLIQNSQNRDSAAIQVKLDELIRVSAARNSLVGIEHLTDDELEDIRNKCEARARAEKAGDETLDKTRKSARRAADRVTS